MTTVRWGIAATGAIAGGFVHALARVDDAEVLAVSSRTRARADAFAGEHAIPRSYALSAARVQSSRLG